MKEWTIQVSSGDCDFRRDYGGKDYICSMLEDKELEKNKKFVATEKITCDYNNCPYRV